jgi:mannosyl-3-phosphoglycerate phosphatase
MLSLRREFNKKLDQIQTVGVGDSLNDLPMLSVVDAPFLAKKPGGWWEKIDLPNLKRIDGVG